MDALGFKFLDERLVFYVSFLPDRDEILEKPLFRRLGRRLEPIVELLCFLVHESVFPHSIPRRVSDFILARKSKSQKV